MLIVWGGHEDGWALGQLSLHYSYMNLTDMFFKAWIIQLYDMYFQPNLFCEIDVHGTSLHIDGLLGICACVLSFGQSSTFAFSCRSRGLRTTPCQRGKTTVLNEQDLKLCWTPSSNRYDSRQWKPVALF